MYFIIKQLFIVLPTSSIYFYLPILNYNSYIINKTLFYLIFLYLMLHASNMLKANKKLFTNIYPQKYNSQPHNVIGYYIFLFLPSTRQLNA